MISSLTIKGLGEKMANDPFQMQRELRYGAPVCDELLIGRFFSIGYSWYFRQAKWVLEIVNRQVQLVQDIPKVERDDNFRADLRIPKRFRAGLKAYVGSGYDRGHLAASANHIRGELVNSETFLLSNMSPQAPNLNRKLWKELEEAVRLLDSRDYILETFVLTCPIFEFDKPITTIGDPHDEIGIDIPVPHAFSKSVLAEDNRGRLKLWTFLMKNEELQGPLEKYLVNTFNVEQMVGGRFWDRVAGPDLYDQKRIPQPMWDLTPAVD
jgi:endonuclease G, mitochondrial